MTERQMDTYTSEALGLADEGLADLDPRGVIGAYDLNIEERNAIIDRCKAHGLTPMDAALSIIDSVWAQYEKEQEDTA